MRFKVKVDTPLTPEQKALVEQNIGLVGVNLRRFGRSLDQPRSTRERDDLFQEGCMALMQAARTYRADCAIPFPAYALPRIRNGIAMTLERGFTTLRLPLRRRGDSRGEHRNEVDRHRPHQVMNGDVDLTSFAASARHDPGEPVEGERLGDRLRVRYDRAVRGAAERIREGRKKRDDLDELVGRLTEQRLMLPSEESRASLREIAIATRSSYARVHSCEQRLIGLIREQLDEDMVFQSVRQEVREHDQGVDTTVDAEIGKHIRARLEKEFTDSYVRLDPPRRLSILSRLLELARTDASDWVREMLRDLADAEFEALIDAFSETPPAPSKATRRLEPLTALA